MGLQFPADSAHLKRWVKECEDRDKEEEKEKNLKIGTPEKLQAYKDRHNARKCPS